jgi:hypothetical protein
MKTILYTAVLMLMTATILTSCGKLQESWQDEQENNQEVKPEKRQVSVTYEIKCSQDVVDALDMVITYKDKGGINATDTLRDTIWTKTVVNEVIPVKIGLSWSLSPKSADKITKETFEDLAASYSITRNGEVSSNHTIARDNLFHYYPSYKDFPASKLSNLCDYENYEHTLRLNNHDYSGPLCYMLKPIADALGYERIIDEPAHWDD